jgi:hypothetical protein
MGKAWRYSDRTARPYLAELMRSEPVVKRVFRWALFAVLMLGGLYAVNGAAYHWWASSGPPTAVPERHRALAFRFALAGLLCFLMAGFSVWLSRARGKRRDDSSGSSQ